MRQHGLHVDDLTRIPDVHHKPEVVPADVEYRPLPDKVGVSKIPPNINERPPPPNLCDLVPSEQWSFCLRMLLPEFFEAPLADYSQ